MRSKILTIFIFLLIVLAGCSPLSAAASAESALDEAATAEPEISTPTITPTSAPNPYSLEGLRERSYGDGELTVEYTWEQNEEFTRYKVYYDSDSYTIHGFANIPVGNGPFPVVVALHGYIPPSEYKTLDYSTRYADAIARKGYIVLHPNLRNFPPSDIVGRIRDYQSGYVVDVMNLLAHVRKEAGEAGIFANADLSRIGVWGHSLGGGTALRLVSIVDEIKAALLYGAVSQRYTNEMAGFDIFDYKNTNAAFSVHHGELDDVISVAWSRLLCTQLEDAGRSPDCYFYADQPHTFYTASDGESLFISRTIEFFDRNLKD